MKTDLQNQIKVAIVFFSHHRKPYLNWKNKNSMYYKLWNTS